MLLKRTIYTNARTNLEYSEEKHQSIKNFSPRQDIVGNGGYGEQDGTKKNQNNNNNNNKPQVVVLRRPSLL